MKKETNIIDIKKVISKIVKNNKSKYYNLFMNIFNNNFNNQLNDYEYYGIDNVKDLNKIEKYLLISICNIFTREDIKSLQKFCELNENKKIIQNDVTKYKTINEIENSIEISEGIKYLKELEKQTKLVFENDEWLVIRPLTHESSKKYGYNTKWCTTSIDSEYFVRYANSGVLIYCLNKLNGYKVAVYKSMYDQKELSFWDQMDKRIDSLESELSDEIKKIIFNICSEEKLESNIQIYNNDNNTTNFKFSKNIFENILYDNTIPPRNMVINPNEMINTNIINANIINRESIF